MKKYYLAIISLLMVLALGAGIFQYVKTFNAEIADAYSAAKPANGHSWAEMQCTTDMCLDTVNHRVGIGTDSPAKPLEVTGDILASGEICNGAGKCLNSVLQNSVIAGTNPTCPAGQTALIKFYNGGAYDASNAGITSWNKISCGQILSGDGSQLLYNNAHTALGCSTAGGTVVSDGTNNFCRFNLDTCPTTWTNYASWTTTAVACGWGVVPEGGWCYQQYPIHNYCTGSHAWSNAGQENTPQNAASNGTCYGTVYATITQRGCY